jgi:hypothetical protein
MDCRYCEIQVEITKRAYAARCPNPVAVLDYIREKMKSSIRPRVDLADMKRSSAPLTLEDNMTISDEKQTDSDLLTTAAKAIGSTLGKIAVKTGMAQPPEPAAKKKTPAAKVATGVKRKTASKRSPKKSAPLAKAKKPAPKGRAGK